MPECFEVDKIAKYLKDSGIEGQTIESLSWCNQGERIAKSDDAFAFLGQIQGQKLISIHTKAKYTFWVLSNGILVWHYRFTGLPLVENLAIKNYLYSIFSLPITQFRESHVRLKINFEAQRLLFVDQRCLSTLSFHPNETLEANSRWQSLPNDLNNIKLDGYSNFKQKYKKSRLDLKTWLLSQETHPSGIGNYLACEICFAAKIHPWQNLNLITENQYACVEDALKSVATLAKNKIDYGWFRVFKRKLCTECSNSIHRQKKTPNSQSTHWCNHCQRLYN